VNTIPCLSDVAKPPAPVTQAFTLQLIAPGPEHEFFRLFPPSVFALLKYYDHLPIDTIFLQLLSFSFSVIFLSSPFIWRLRRVNHDIRVERHALEDFRRKWIMLLLRVAQGDEAMRNQQTADIIQHFDKRGTPEVLNHLYHPRHAHPRPADDDSLLKRVVAMPKSLTERKE